MNRDCAQCSAPFEITQDDLDFYEKISPEFNGKKEQLPPPTLCPDCRFQRRLSLRNLRNLFHRTCALTNKPILSCYPPSSPFVVYQSEEWWSDKWDPMQYGRDFDFSRPFFAQFAELHRAVPTVHQYSLSIENCDYINGAANCRNCYLSFMMDYCEDSYYIAHANIAKSCMDCLGIAGCELCYECVDCKDCYRTLYSQRSINCSDSWFLMDCRRCRNCIACCNLTDKEYYVFNEPVSPEEFKKRARDLQQRPALQRVREIMQEQQLKAPKKYYFGQAIEHSTGENIDHLKNCRSCFDASELEDCSYCNYAFKSHHCMDLHVFGDHSEWLYECTATGPNCSFDIACLCCWTGSSNCLYCHLISACKNCFGCSGLRNKSYCIFNKQYTKEEYEKLVPKIIEHMGKTGEWGENFPTSMSPFGYNLSEAAEYYPMTKEEVLNRGWQWFEEEGKQSKYMGPDITPPDSIADVSDDITKSILRCEVTGNPYKVILPELKLCRTLGIPLPRKCPEQRHRERFALRNPRKLWDRQCMKCKKDIETTYSPERPEIVYCEECYLSALQ